MRTARCCLALSAALSVGAAEDGSELDRPGVLALIAADPVAAVAAGGSLFRREFSTREGAGEARGIRMQAARAQSCIVCHNVPYGDAGAGATIGRSGPTGRSTPHLFGAGALEQLGEAITDALLARVDRDRDGTVTAAEAAGVPALVDPDGDGPEAAVDFGHFADRDGDGRPDLDPALRLWYVDPSGRRQPSARGLGDPGVAGYRFAHGAFGWSADDGEDPRATASLRTFIVGAFAAHAGIEADDTGLREVDGSGRAAATPSGSRPLVPGTAPDPGIRRDADGRSLDDPDGDGVMAELGAAEVDLVEYYLFHHRQPEERRDAPGAAAGRRRFAAIGCTACHVPEWRFAGRGDRRDGAADLLVTGLYSDLRHHDLGTGFHQIRFDGGTTLRFRTPPLWGVGGSAPYGHDGASLDLDAVIRRHGGEAAASATAYRDLDERGQLELVGFLRSLVLVPSADPR